LLKNLALAFSPNKGIIYPMEVANIQNPKKVGPCLRRAHRYALTVIIGNWPHYQYIILFSILYILGFDSILQHEDGSAQDSPNNALLSVDGVVVRLNIMPHICQGICERSV
jgi:hypothetical protein